MKKNRIIVIGGGYAGLRAIEKLAKNPHNEIMLFDKESYHFMQTDVYDLIANEHDFVQVSVDLFTFCLGFDENVSFVKEEVTQVNFEQKKSPRKRSVTAMTTLSSPWERALSL